MAIVKGPAMSIEASGNVGAINYTRWKGIQVARTTFTYTDPDTSKQQAQRGLLTTLSSKWGDVLTANEREQWGERAAEEVFTNRLGMEYRPSGYQYFMKLNLQSAFLSAKFTAAPPMKPDAVYVLRLRLLASAGQPENIVAFEKAFTVRVEADGFEIFRAGPFVSGGRRPIEPEYRFLALETVSYAYLDAGIIDTKYYWYKVRWFFEEGYVGNWWEGQLQADFP